MDTDPKNTIKVELVHNWRKMWSFYSIKFLALGGAVQTVVVTMSATSAAQYVHPWIMAGLADFSLLCMVAAAVGRVIKQPDKE